jgi:hypothetical protein
VNVTDELGDKPRCGPIKRSVLSVTQFLVSPLASIEHRHAHGLRRQT